MRSIIRMSHPTLAVALAIVAIGLAGCGSGGGGGGGGSSAATSPTPGSGTLFGATFTGATSRQLWSGLTLPSTQTAKNRFDAEDGEYTSTIVYNADTQRGIACVKVEETGQETVWLAKDTQGRVFVIQTGEGATPDQPTTIDATTYYPTQGVTVGQTWVTDDAGDHQTWEVIATDATAPRNGTTGCTLLRITSSYDTPDTGDDDVWYIWWSNAKGEVEGADSTTVAPDQSYFYIDNPIT